MIDLSFSHSSKDFTKPVKKYNCGNFILVSIYIKNRSRSISAYSEFLYIVSLTNANISGYFDSIWSHCERIGRFA